MVRKIKAGIKGEAS
jgi:pescadillo